MSIKTGFYVIRLMDEKDSKTFPIEAIITFEELKIEILKELDYREWEDYVGWDPEDYTLSNKEEFRKEYREKREKVNQADIKQFIKNERIQFAWKFPTELEPSDFEVENNPIFVDVDMLETLISF